MATTSFGHGIAVTPLQFIDAVGGVVRDGMRVPPTLLKRDPDAIPPREPLRLRAHRRASALAHVARGGARHRHTGEPRQLRDRRQDRHRREACRRPLQPGQRSRLFRRAHSRSTRRATWCSPHWTSPRATPAPMASATAAGQRRRWWRRSSTGSGRCWAYRPARPTWWRSIARDWRSCTRRHTKLTRREASLAAGSAVR